MKPERQWRLAAISFVLGERQLARLLREEIKGQSHSPAQLLAWRLSVLEAAAAEDSPQFLTAVRNLIEPRARS